MPEFEVSVAMLADEGAHPIVTVVPTIEAAIKAAQENEPEHQHAAIAADLKRWFNWKKGKTDERVLDGWEYSYSQVSIEVVNAPVLEPPKSYGAMGHPFSSGNNTAYCVNCGYDYLLHGLTEKPGSEPKSAEPVSGNPGFDFTVYRVKDSERHGGNDLFFIDPQGRNVSYISGVIDGTVMRVKAEKPDTYNASDLESELLKSGILGLPITETDERW